MLDEEETYETQEAKKDLNRWIEENKEYVKAKLKNTKNPTYAQLVELVDDESIEEFNARHQTSNFLCYKFVKLSNFL